MSQSNISKKNTHAHIAFDDPKRYQMSSQCTWTSVGVNTILTVVQIFAGIFAHSQSLIADGIHTLSDLIADFLVLIASYHSKSPADNAHPYGHGRIETAASFALGAILVLTGIGIMVGTAIKLEHLATMPPVAPLALWAAGLTLMAKEGLFRYMLYVGEQLRSPMLVANAWHARSDAASSLVVVIGIGANMLGILYADSIAAIIVGFMIVRMGAVFSWEAFQELIDTGLSFEDVDSIRQTLADTQGVLNIHELRTRKMAHRVLVDAHILVDSRISVSEGHSIAERARARVLASHEVVDNVLVHVDMEDDLTHDDNANNIPGRDLLLKSLAKLLFDLPTPEHVVFHYLAGKVEAEVWIPSAFFKTKTSVKTARDLIAERLINHAYFSAVSLNTRL